MSMTALAPMPRRTPASRSAGAPPAAAATGSSAAARMNGRQKAAIIVRLLLSEGTELPLQALPDHVQAALTEQIGMMRSIDHATLRAVVEEFCQMLDQVGLSFPGGIEGALRMLDGRISATAASRLRRLAHASSRADPWDRIAALDSKRLMPVLTEESPEVGAVMLSKIAVARAAELLGQLPGDRARRLAHAVSQTGAIDPETVRRIGLSLAAQLEAEPPRAFEAGPVERVGAILNASPAATREAVLDGLAETDAGFAAEVRKAIFTFTNIPARIATRDVPRVIREVDQPVLITALAGAKGDDALSAEFILANMSQRMAANLREEMTERGKVRDKDAEAAMAAVTTAIRELAAAGEITLVDPEAADEDD